MKTLGLLGGMTYPSTTLYYTANDLARARLGSSHSAPLLLYSFDVLSRLIATNDWQAAAALLIDAAEKLESIGSEGLIICANVMQSVERRCCRCQCASIACCG